VSAKQISDVVVDICGVIVRQVLLKTCRHITMYLKKKYSEDRQKAESFHSGYLAKEFFSESRRSASNARERTLST